ncbi:hypothetical protein LTR86_003046 [Recurvomyces mirabilis]|nr:hypothetical protein LTR86_003046 [Recurvomyces mirabilis]
MLEARKAVSWLSALETATERHEDDTRILPTFSETPDPQSRLPPSNVEDVLPAINDALAASTTADLSKTTQHVAKPIYAPNPIHTLLGDESSAPLNLPKHSLLDLPDYDPAWFNIDPEIYYDNNTNSCG